MFFIQNKLAHDGMDQLSFSFQRIIIGYPLKHSLLLMYLKLKTAKMLFYLTIIESKAL